MVLIRIAILLSLLFIITSCNYGLAHVDGLYSECGFYVPIEWEVSYSADAGKHYYIYNDSGAIYHEIDWTQNYNNIITAKLYDLYRNKLQEGDRFEIWGIDSNGKYWKNVSWHRVNVGYLNVDSSVKAKYDQCIETFNCY